MGGQPATTGGIFGEINDRMLRYKQINTHFFTDTLVFKESWRLTRGYRYAQLFVSDKDFVYTVLMKKRRKLPLTLKEFAQEIGVPTKLILDSIGEHKSNNVKQFAKECSWLCI